jgi:hypothetical protein
VFFNGPFGALIEVMTASTNAFSESEQIILFASVTFLPSKIGRAVPIAH